MPTRKTPPPTAPSIAPEKGYAELKKQLDIIQSLKGLDYREAETAENHLRDYAERVLEMTFGKPSTALDSFRRARTAGSYRFLMPDEPTPHGENQNNFIERLNAMESSLGAALSELELKMPEKEIKGHYDAGEEYEFYRDVKQILALAKTEVFIIDPYLSDDIFNLYADGINRSINLRILSNNIPASTASVATKYAAGGNLSLRTTAAIHDRLILIDERAWLIGQSIKDAAKKKPTYIVEQSAEHIRPAYEAIWASATVVY
jgi:hypothetical protein